MSGSLWNRSGRRSGGARPFVIPVAAASCVGCESGATNADEIVKALIAEVVEIEAQRGITIDWLSKLPADAAAHTSRDVVNAIGLALTEAGVPNNLFREVAS